MSGVYVFLGPSLSMDEARAVLPGATFLPPAAMGDVHRLLSRRPAAIGLVDGLFEQTPSVWHKELLLALERGVRVAGASSMGALRAAELWPFGMEAVGAIATAYRDGALDGDDEVAVVHAAADHGYRALSEPLVNLRDGLARAERAGAIAAATRDALAAAGKALFYPDRSWAALLGVDGVDAEERGRLAEFVRRERPNLKRDDALLLLTRLREPAPAPAPRVIVERTKFFLQLAEHQEGDEPRHAQAIRDHVRVATPDLRALLSGALLLHLVGREAARLGIVLSPEEFDAAAARFRARRDLLSGESAKAWTREQRVDHDEFARLVTLEHQLDALLAHHARDVEALLLTELRRRGRLGEVAGAVTEKRRFLRAAGLENPTFGDAGGAAPVFEWYQRRVGPLRGALEDHARALGFDSLRLFLTELLEQYVFEAGGRGREEEGAHAATF